MGEKTKTIADLVGDVQVAASNVKRRRAEHAANPGHEAYALFSAALNVLWNAEDALIKAAGGGDGF